MYKTIIQKISGASLALAFAVGASIASADVSGTWTLNVQLGDLGGGTPTVTMTEDAEGKITGNYNGQLGQSPIEGKAEGNDFQFAITSDMGSVTYKGTLQEDGTVKGTVDFGGMGGGTFTGKKSG